MNPCINIARYHAYVACIECRLNYLKVYRDYNGFMSNVYPYISFLCSNKAMDANLLVEKERDMWGFSWGLLKEYLTQLREKSIYSATSDVKLESICRDELLRYSVSSFATIKKAAEYLFELDGQKCDLIARVNLLPDDVKLQGLNAVDGANAVMLLKKLDVVLPFYISIAKNRTLETDGKYRLIYPTPLGSELMSWASHLGNSIILLAEDKLDDARKQHHAGNEHLCRAVLDIYKLILNSVLREKTKMSSKVSKTFWEKMILVRKQDHDNEKKEVIIKGYEELVFILKKVLSV